MRIDPVQHPVDVGIAACANDIMDTASVLVPPVPLQGVVGDGRKRAKVGHGAPQSVADCEVGRMDCPGLAAEKAFLQIAGIPEIEVTDLRSFGADDAEEMTGGYIESLSITWSYGQLRDPLHPFTGLVVEGSVDPGPVGRRIDGALALSSPARRVGGFRNGNRILHSQPPLGYWSGFPPASVY